MANPQEIKILHIEESDLSVLDLKMFGHSITSHDLGYKDSDGTLHLYPSRTSIDTIIGNTSLLDLSDTPSSYGGAGKILALKSDNKNFEFIDSAGLAKGTSALNISNGTGQWIDLDVDISENTTTQTWTNNTGKDIVLKQSGNNTWQASQIPSSLFDIVNKQYVDTHTNIYVGFTLLDPKATDSFPAFISPNSATTITRIVFYSSGSINVVFNSVTYAVNGIKEVTLSAPIAMPANSHPLIATTTDLDDGYLTVSFVLQRV